MIRRVRTLVSWSLSPAATFPSTRVLSGRTTESGRHAGLDLLRALAVGLVLVYHLPGRLESWPPWLEPLGKIGWIGVEMFFALSGFLVGGLLLRDYPDVRVGRFLLRRGMKIYPASYVMLVALMLIVRAEGLSVPTAAWWHEALFVQNYFAGVNAPSWSLAVEEHFYLILAGVVALLAWRRAPVSVLGIVALVVGLFEIVERLSMRAPFPYSLTHLRLDSLFWGVGLAVVHRELGADALIAFSRRHCEPLLLSIGALIAAPNVVSLALPAGGVNFRYAVGYTAISLASLVLIVLVLPLERLRGAGAVVARVGRDSYGIYLWHGPLYLIGGGLPKAHIGVFDPLRAAALMAGSITLGIVMSAAIEWPLLRWRDRRFPSRRELGPNMDRVGLAVEK